MRSALWEYKLGPANPVDPVVAMRVAAESYAFYAALVSIPMTLAAIAVFLFARHDLRSASLAAAILCMHPAWTVTETWYDDGATLRLASTAWIVLACVALAVALFSACRHGMKTREHTAMRFTSRSLVMLTTIVAVILVLSRPPISDVVPVSRSLPSVGLTFMLIIALHSPVRRRHRKLPIRIAIPLDVNAGRDGLGPRSGNQ